MLAYLERSLQKFDYVQLLIALNNNSRGPNAKNMLIIIIIQHILHAILPVYSISKSTSVVSRFTPGHANNFRLSHLLPDFDQNLSSFFVHTVQGL